VDVWKSRWPLDFKREAGVDRLHGAGPLSLLVSRRVRLSAASRTPPGVVWDDRLRGLFSRLPPEPRSDPVVRRTGQLWHPRRGPGEVDGGWANFGRGGRTIPRAGARLQTCRWLLANLTASVVAFRRGGVTATRSVVVETSPSRVCTTLTEASAGSTASMPRRSIHPELPDVRHVEVPALVPYAAGRAGFDSSAGWRASGRCAGCGRLRSPRSDRSPSGRMSASSSNRRYAPLRASPRPAP